MTVQPGIFPPPPPAPCIEPDFKIAFILSPQFSLLPFAGFIDCLRHAADEIDHSRQIHCHWQVVANDIKPVTASCGVKMTPNMTLSECGDVDYIAVCGGQLPWSMEVADQTLDFIRNAYETGTTVIGVCTGSFIIARTGLLDGKNCALNVLHRDQFNYLFPESKPITNQNFVVDHRIITSIGGTSTIDLACHLIETHSGKARAVKALNGLVVDHRRKEHHMPPRMFGHLASCGNWRVEQAAALMEQNFARPYNVANLAERLKTSQRELHRAFNKHAKDSPSGVYRNMRLSHGHWLLTNTNRTITQISHECGFSDGAHFSRWFKQTYGESPSHFRVRRRHI